MSTFLPPRAFTVTLAPLASVPIDGPGITCSVQAATREFKIGFDLGAPFWTGLGRRYQCLPGDAFNRVVVENPSETDPVTLTLLIGRMIETDSRLNVVGVNNGLALDGTDGTGIVPPAGGAGIRGFLSGIYNRLGPGTVAWVPTQGIADVVTASTPVRLSGVDVFCDQLDIRANTANAGVVRYGFSDTVLLWELSPTEWRGFKAPTGKRINVKDVWLDADVNGDGVVWETRG